MKTAKSFLLLSFLGFFLTGCAGAELIKTSLDPKGGTIRYKNGPDVRKESRGIAMSQIEKFCSGPIKFVSEEYKQEELPVESDGSPLMPEKAREEAPNMYITFICES